MSWPTMEEERFVIVRWPDCQHFMDDRSAIHLADGDDAYKEFGDSSYFVSKSFYEKRTRTNIPLSETVFVAVPFPESKSFPHRPGSESYPITDMVGIDKYGQGACFVKEEIYNRICKANGRVSDVLKEGHIEK